MNHNNMNSLPSDKELNRYGKKTVTVVDANSSRYGMPNSREYSSYRKNPDWLYDKDGRKMRLGEALDKQLTNKGMKPLEALKFGEDDKMRFLGFKLRETIQDGIHGPTQVMEWYKENSNRNGITKEDVVTANSKYTVLGERTKPNVVKNYLERKTLRGKVKHVMRKLVPFIK